MASHKININTAALEELTQVHGIGPKIAQKIIQTRNLREFSSLEELERMGIPNLVVSNDMRERLFCGPGPLTPVSSQKVTNVDEEFVVDSLPTGRNKDRYKGRKILQNVHQEFMGTSREKGRLTEAHENVIPELNQQQASNVGGLRQDVEVDNIRQGQRNISDLEVEDIPRIPRRRESRALVA